MPVWRRIEFDTSTRHDIFKLNNWPVHDDNAAAGNLKVADSIYFTDTTTSVG